jgi:flagellar motor switch/type III secretory pathway protein FliN
MSEVLTNSVSNGLEASQTGTPGETTSQSAASAQGNLDTQPTPRPIPDPPRRTGKREFSPYTRSLLRVRVPVVVTLAEKKQTLGRILEIGPGQILQFDKSCEETLDLEVSNCKIACGEAVKVGDKFGLRITAIVPPEERFVPVRPTNKV